MKKRTVRFQVLERREGPVGLRDEHGEVQVQLGRLDGALARRLVAVLCRFDPRAQHVGGDSRMARQVQRDGERRPVLLLARLQRDQLARGVGQTVEIARQVLHRLQVARQLLIVLCRGRLFVCGLRGEFAHKNDENQIDSSQHRQQTQKQHEQSATVVSFFTAFE
jgi:hypothetical protein